VVELGGLLAGGLGLVEVLREGVGAGPEVERLVGSIGDGVRVSGLGSFATLIVVGRCSEAGGVGVSQSHVAACWQGQCLGSGVHREADGGEGGQYRGE